MDHKHWETPKSRMVGLFADLRLFSEALDLAKNQGSITRFDLEEELSQSVRGQLYLERQSPRRWADLIRELRHFSWFEVENRFAKPQDDANHRITQKGISALLLSKEDYSGFLRLLASKMHEQYVIPGWFVDRLWKINPDREGEVIVPAPQQNWKPASREWENKDWDIELQNETEFTHDVIQKVCPGSFPIEKDIWVQSVEAAWDRLGNLKRRRVSNPPKGFEGKPKNRVATYSVRGRLTKAMKEAAVKLLFSKKQPNTDVEDFWVSKEPLLPRIYEAWMPRLRSLELIFYTDAHPNVPGRLLFPTSAFKKNIPPNSFFALPTIKNPSEETLCLHQPTWSKMRGLFLNVLWEEHQRAAAEVGSLYAPLLDIRDEVCRRLRISALLFETFIEQALRESIQSDSKFSISVETDIREDHRSGSRLLRQPVWIMNVPHSLIAITELQKK